MQEAILNSAKVTSPSKEALPLSVEVPTVSPPVEVATLRLPFKVDVALENNCKCPVELIEPPVNVNPLEAETPVAPKAPDQVDVPTIEELNTEPAAIVKVVPESNVNVPDV